VTKIFPDVLQACVGAPVAQIDTPALVIDLDAMERNIARMAQFARQHQVRWRPHAKLHKCAEIALLLQSAGATGACVQKVAEAEALAAGGMDDLYISNEVIAPTKLLRVARLAQQLEARGGQLAIAVDSLEGIARLATALDSLHAPTAVVIDVFIEIDAGQGRCGVLPGAAAVPLAQAIARHPQRLRFAGLQAYHGGAQHLRSAAERQAAIAQTLARAQQTCDALHAAGIAVSLVTGAGTGTLANEARSGLYGELQPGSFLFMDADYARNEADPAQPVFEHALFVKTQVISRSATHAVCDAGHKSHAIDSGLPQVHALTGEPVPEFFNGGDEHGLLRPATLGASLPALGDCLWLIPGHCDPTVNLHNAMLGVRGGLAQGVVERIFCVDGRGAVT
jgi:D-serine deaminase-like pyridoxal phosphate-dependent protein